MIDLHMHTTVSDGRSTPASLVAEATAAGCHTIAVTDHDTVGGLADARAVAEAAGLVFFDGIEITAVRQGRDVHVLGYFIDPRHEGLAAFLVTQRESRRERLVAMADRLARVGAVIDLDRLLGEARPGKALGRPMLAHALVEAGHARDISDAFERYLAEGRPAYLGREGSPVDTVIARIRAAGGVAAVAHPGKFRDDSVVPEMVAAGMQAIEVFHPDHTADDVERYEGMAQAYGLAVTGGSDYHGPGSGRTSGLGVVGLPADRLARLLACRG